MRAASFACEDLKVLFLELFIYLFMTMLGGKHV
jgi:hypothetical protein